jgi:hypothetical protein
VTKSIKSSNIFVERAQQPGVLVGAPFEKSLRFQLARLAKVVDQHMAHLPAMALLLAHHAQQALTIIIRWRRVDQLSL